MHLYEKRKKNPSKGSFITLVIFLGFMLFFIYILRITEERAGNEELELLNQGIRKAVVSCYAVEGKYPDSLEYLKEHYGLIVDEEKYIVTYDVFASNVMPEIYIVRKNATGNEVGD